MYSFCTLGSYSFIEDHRCPVVSSLLQHKHNVARHYSQLITGLRNKLKQDSVWFTFQSPVKMGNIRMASEHMLVIAV